MFTIRSVPEDSEPSLVEVTLLEKQALICLRGQEYENYWPTAKNLASLKILVCIDYFNPHESSMSPTSEPD